MTQQTAVMGRLVRLAGAGLLLTFAVAAQGSAENRLTADELSAGWRLLFDGTTSDGWLEVTGLAFPQSCWSVENGCLRARPNPQGFQDLRTRALYGSFDLQFEWRLTAGGNSGVKYLVQRTDRWQRKGEPEFSARARGLEYQIADDLGNPDARSSPMRATASLYSFLAPYRRVEVKPGAFHRSRIIVKGDQVEHWMDGVQVLDFKLSQPVVADALRQMRAKPQAGATSALQPERETFISLQNHGSEIEFRNLKIKRLD
ncbi:MAG: DUF1080 domain-containing protein [Acidobacteria bacterium]|nr:DUF1080 domain-containing protein [Acidobacteriota bacterium]